MVSIRKALESQDARVTRYAHEYLQLEEQSDRLDREILDSARHYHAGDPGYGEVLHDDINKRTDLAKRALKLEQYLKKADVQFEDPISRIPNNVKQAFKVKPPRIDKGSDADLDRIWLKWNDAYKDLLKYQTQWAHDYSDFLREQKHPGSNRKPIKLLAVECNEQLEKCQRQSKVEEHWRKEAEHAWRDGGRTTLAVPEFHGKRVRA